MEGEISTLNPSIDEFMCFNIHPISENYMYKPINAYNGGLSMARTDTYNTWIKRFPRDEALPKEKLNIKGEDKFLGRGVSYCATCDSAFFKNKTVAVVGGGNTAVSAALLLAEHAKKIYIIHRKDKFARVDQILLSRLEKEAKITIIFNSEISEINGEKAVTGITLKDNTLAVDGVFIEIGFSPSDSLIRQLNLETENKYVRVDKFQRTSLRGVFAAGDITNNPLKQVITACSEGSIATTTAYDEIRAEMAQIAEIYSIFLKTNKP